MVRHEGGRWDVSIKDNAIYLERVSDSDEQLFGDSLAVDEARGLAGLLTKFADKLEESGESRESEEPDESNDAGEPDESEESDDSGESEKSSESGT